MSEDKPWAMLNNTEIGERFEKLQGQLIDVIKSQADLEKRVKDMEPNNANHILYEQWVDKLNGYFNRLEAIEERLKEHWKTIEEETVVVSHCKYREERTKEIREDLIEISGRLEVMRVHLKNMPQTHWTHTDYRIEKLEDFMKEKNLYFSEDKDWIKREKPSESDCIKDCGKEWNDSFCSDCDPLGDPGCLTYTIPQEEIDIIMRELEVHIKTNHYEIVEKVLIKHAIFKEFISVRKEHFNYLYERATQRDDLETLEEYTAKMKEIQNYFGV